MNASTIRNVLICLLILLFTLFILLLTCLQNLYSGSLEEKCDNIYIITIIRIIIITETIISVIFGTIFITECCYALERSQRDYDEIIVIVDHDSESISSDSDEN